ncbi:MAG: hypothetical protein EAZ55_09265 [Cytophagales bacterium]|nr:MAG: hypothetical protein EAZ55_09265 [Cytophagales bacterium]
MRIVFLIVLFLFSCKNKGQITTPNTTMVERQTKTISYNNTDVTVLIENPTTNKEVDVLLVFHGTVQSDSEIMTAANTTLDKFKSILDNKEMMIVSVAHPQENILFGDNIAQAEAALLWLKNNANQDLGIIVRKIFLAGHSQGVYLVTRLNTMHPTNGVIANAPGPLNLVYRCQLEEEGQIQASLVCARLKNTYGTTTNNYNAYFQRSLLNFTNGFKSDILFVQGLNDAPIQMYSWQTFKQDISNCTTCQKSQFVEISGGHTALFDNSAAKAEFNKFINSR